MTKFLKLIKKIVWYQMGWNTKCLPKLDHIGLPWYLSMAFCGNETDNREKWRKLTKSFPLISELIQFQQTLTQMRSQKQLSPATSCTSCEKTQGKNTGLYPCRKAKITCYTIIILSDKKHLAIQHTCSFRYSLPHTSRGSQKRPWESWEYSCWKCVCRNL